MAWINSNWLYRHEIRVNSTPVDATLSDFTLRVEANSTTAAALAAAVVAGEMPSSGNDILFTSSDEVTQLSHERIRWNSGTGELICDVKVPTVFSGSTTVLYMYYGYSAVGSDQQDSAATWSNNYSAVYHMESLGGAGSALLDSVSETSEGTVTGGATLTASDQSFGGKALQLDGSTQYLSIPDRAALDLTGDFTLEAWFKRDTANNYEVLLNKGAAGTFDYTMLIEPDSVGANADKLSFYSDATGATHAADAVEDTTNYFHYMISRSGNTVNYYISGANSGSRTASGTLTTSSDALFIGTDNNTPSTPGFADGNIGEIRISSVGRSGAWARATYEFLLNQSTYVTWQTQITEDQSDDGGGGVDPGTTTIPMYQSKDIIPGETPITVTVGADVTWWYYVAGGVGIEIPSGQTSLDMTEIIPVPVGSGASRRNGYAVNMFPEAGQGFDGRGDFGGGGSYSDGLGSTSLPRTLNAEDSVILTVSDVPTQTTGSGPQTPEGAGSPIHRSPLQTAARFIVVANGDRPSDIPAGSTGLTSDEFCPPWTADPSYNYLADVGPASQGFSYQETALPGTEYYYYGPTQRRPRYSWSDVQQSLIADVVPPSEMTAEFASGTGWTWPYETSRDQVSGESPAEMFEKYVRHPWFSHLEDVKSQAVHPRKYMGSYWETYAVVLGDCLAASTLPYPNKLELVKGLIQIGIDQYWQSFFGWSMARAVDDPATLGVGRRIGSEITPVPPLLAGHLLNDQTLKDAMKEYTPSQTDLGGINSGFRVCYQTYYMSTGSVSSRESALGLPRLPWVDRDFSGTGVSVQPDGSTSNVSLQFESTSAPFYDYSDGSPYTAKPTGREVDDYILWRKDVLEIAELEHLYPFQLSSGVGGSGGEWANSASGVGDNLWGYGYDYYMSNPSVYPGYMVPALIMNLKQYWDGTGGTFTGTPTSPLPTTEAWDFMRRWWQSSGPAGTGESIDSTISLDAQAIYARDEADPQGRATWYPARQYWGQARSDVVAYLQRDYWDTLIGGLSVIAAFSATTTTSPTLSGGTATVDFSAAASTGTGLTYTWDFDWDNPGTNTGTGVTPTATYTSAGTYTVRLLVSDGSDSDTQIRTGYITILSADLPGAVISANPTTGLAPLTVSFDGSASTGSPSMYEWDFPGSDTPGPLTGATQTVIYSNEGTYTATLTVSDSNGTVGPSGVATQTITVQLPALVASFTATPLTGTIPLTVSFDASGSTGDIDSYRWDWGDGTTDTVTTAQTTHTYEQVGTFSVRLTVTRADTGQTAQFFIEDYVEATPDQITVTATSSSAGGQVPQTIQFNSSATGGDPNNYETTWTIEGPL